jgi:hypothetical protein
MGQLPEYHERQTVNVLQQAENIVSSSELSDSSYLGLSVLTNLVVQKHACKEDKCIVHRLIKKCQRTRHDSWVKIKQVDVVNTVSRPNKYAAAPEPL